MHETTNFDSDSPYYGQPFKSDLAISNNNFGGLTQEEPNDTPQPDGTCYYMAFSSPEAYAQYFGKYLHYYREDGIYNSENIDDYITALKKGGYFGDSLERYLTNVKRIYEENFPPSTIKRILIRKTQWQK